MTLLYFFSFVPISKDFIFCFYHIFVSPLIFFFFFLIIATSYLFLFLANIFWSMQLGVLVFQFTITSFLSLQFQFELSLGY